MSLKWGQILSLQFLIGGGGVVQILGSCEAVRANVIHTQTSQEVWKEHEWLEEIRMWECHLFGNLGHVFKRLPMFTRECNACAVGSTSRGHIDAMCLAFATGGAPSQNHATSKNAISGRWTRRQSQTFPNQTTCVCARIERKHLTFRGRF